ncbi:hypothetical protein [Paenibacillus sp. FSL K6-2524]|uniref:hypothetical protein n=1 Tax=Paenibacillus sp. FSL K6-2524 TaxID=2954516 RepID=UPI0030FAA3AD
MALRNPDEIDGLKVVNGKVNGKIPIEDYYKIRDASVHNAYSDSMTLGKWNDEGISYLTSAKDNGSMFFDLGDDWGVTKIKFGINDADMFEVFNKPALDDAISGGKIICFSHNPELVKYFGSSLEAEWKYLQNRGFTELIQEGNVWIAK